MDYGFVEKYETLPILHLHFTLYSLTLKMLPFSQRRVLVLVLAGTTRSIVITTVPVLVAGFW